MDLRASGGRQESKMNYHLTTQFEADCRSLLSQSTHSPEARQACGATFLPFGLSSGGARYSSYRTRKVSTEQDETGATHPKSLWDCQCVLYPGSRNVTQAPTAASILACLQNHSRQCLTLTTWVSDSSTPRAKTRTERVTQRIETDGTDTMTLVPRS